MKPPRTLHLVSLGCAKNRVDSEVLAGIARRRGVDIVSDPERADIIVVNTCAFIESAREESVEVLLEMARYTEDGHRRLVVTGCMAQRYATTLAEEMPEISHLIGTAEIERLEEILEGEAPRVLVGSAAGHYLQRTDTPRFTEPNAASAYLKIADGCSRRCAFCAIPAIRGKGRSRPLGEVVDEAARLAALGIRELNLVAQDTSAYGRDLGDGTDLTALIRALDQVPEIDWIRLLYLYPDAVSEALVEAVAASPHVVPYFDIPIQHAADGMLKRMRRGHDARALRRLIRRIRERIPAAFFRTAVLVGHPGETPAEFDDLMAFIEWARFDHLGAFRYSHEEGTASAGLPDRVTRMNSYNRYRKVMALQRRISREKNRALMGRSLEVLVEETADDAGYVLKGRHAGQAPEVDGVTYLVISAAAPGELISARVVQTGDFDVVAEQI